MGSVANGRLPSAADPGFGFPHGHQGNLTEAEAKSLQDFKKLLEEKGEYSPGPPATCEDHKLLRFLRARRWIPQDAYKQYSENEAFRKANQIDVLFETMDVDAYEKTKTLYPRYTGRRDKRGMPVYVYRISHLDSKAVAAYEKETHITYSKAKTDGKTPAKLLRLIALYEDLTLFMQPLCTACPDREHAPTPITLSTNVVDISHVSLKMFWNLRQHMQAASELATTHYPETLDRIFIIGAPYFFSTVWGWIKKWFDPVTVSKIFILSHSEIIPVLSQFMEMKDIPKVYGGELPWEYFDEPAWDDGIMNLCQWENGYTCFPPGPKKWVPIDDGKRFECIAIGYKDGEPRHDRVCTIPNIEATFNSVNGSAEKAAETTPSAAEPVSADAVETVAAPAVAAAAVEAAENTTNETAAVAPEAVTTTDSTEEVVATTAEAKTNGTIEVAGAAITLKGEEVFKGDHITTAPVDEVEALKLTNDEVKALEDKKHDVQDVQAVTTVA